MNSAQPTVATFIYTSRKKCSPGCSFRPKKNINGYICTMNNGSNMVPNSIKSIPLNISIIGLWLWFYQPRFPCRVRGGVASGVPRCYLDFPCRVRCARGGCVRSVKVLSRDHFPSLLPPTGARCQSFYRDRKFPVLWLVRFVVFRPLIGWGMFW